MDFGLENRVAIVTGGARGIGRAHCERLGAEGARVVIVDLDGEAAAQTEIELSAQGTVCEAIVGDAAEEGDIESARTRVLETYGRIDVLINNAGAAVKPACAVEDMPAEAWDHMMRAHTRSTFLWSRAVVPAMKARGFGRIVNTSSMNFTGGGRPGVAHYSAAKAAIAGFTRTFAKEVGEHGITVNAIAPGYVETDLIGSFSEAMRRLLRDQNPVGRMCRPEEVAALAAYLCSTYAGFINGELVCIDGGRRDYVWD